MRLALSGEVSLERIKATLEDIFGHALDDAVDLLGRGVKLRDPLRKGAVAIGYPGELQRRLMIGNGLRGLNH